MTHTVLVQSKVVAKDIDSLNRAAVQASDDLDNGWLISLPTQDTAGTYGQTEVWDATKPATATLAAMWMVYEPEVVTTVSGTKQYKGINPDPQDFYVPALQVFSAYKPQIGDIILITADGLATGSGAGSAFAVAVNATYKLTWAAAAISGLSYAYLSTSYISLGSGAIDSQRVVAYKFQCVAVA